MWQVSSLAFQAFDCESFDEGLSFLKADFAVDCHDAAAYGRVGGLAWVAIALVRRRRSQHLRAALAPAIDS